MLAGVLLVGLGTALGAALLAGLRRTLRGGNFESDHRADQPAPSALAG